MKSDNFCLCVSYDELLILKRSLTCYGGDLYLNSLTCPKMLKQGYLSCSKKAFDLLRTIEGVSNEKEDS